ncbi:MAG: Dam family site-specific DNA-(adenine-N6)-methyltransferase [Elusimicrobiota bacterium]|jgi:adenine-specific DNA-methyltransferase|nr:Dam family site-specific DNA-(adenine-N6)-methyltransferase [Elusimicrobiota bacterium]
MRFIGGKTNLLNNIDSVIKENTTGKEKIFCDLFSGTAAVARFFKPKYNLISNDALHFSFVIQKAVIENNQIPKFLKLKKKGINDPLNYLETANLKNDNKFSQGFIFQNYSPSSKDKRMYFTNNNAQRIDFIRNGIELWRKRKDIDEIEYYYLLASLIEGIPGISNITGTYGAFLKYWDKRAYQTFKMSKLNIIDNNRINMSFNDDALKLIKNIEGDIIYIDPPYNSRQYLPNYHLLETISLYDKPKIHGVTGMREYIDKKSPFCIKKEALDAFNYLIENVKFENIVMSYSCDGIMSAKQIESVLKKHCISDTYRFYKYPYRKYKGKEKSAKASLYEYIFYIRKNIKNKKIKDNHYYVAQDNAKYCVFANKRFLKSPLNYIGGKYKLLKKIIPQFPNNINTFVDLFCGGANVAINVPANKIVCNDINSKIIEIFQTFQKLPIDNIIREIEHSIKQFGLDKENEAGFQSFRKYYNQTHNPIDLYTLSCYSFNYQIRFNNNMEYNNPFGRNRSRFSIPMKKNLIAFCQEIKRKQIEWTAIDFKDFSVEMLRKDDFVYCDPPYLITLGSYNDGKRGFKDWKEEQEIQLYNLLDSLNERGIRFALSNVSEHKGKTNKILDSWSKKYRVIDMDYNYSNSCYNTKRQSSREILAVNY